MTRLKADPSRFGILLAALALFAGGAQAQSAFDASGTVCRSPSNFCGRTVHSSCLTRLSVGAVDAGDEATGEEIAGADCRSQIETYRDCLTLVARQCAVAAAPAPVEPPDAEAMLAIWNEVKDSGDAEALDAFADLYPTTPLAALARNRARALREAAAAPPDDGGEDAAGAGAAASEDAPPSDLTALALKAAERARNREAQAHLARTGYDPGLADGIWGPRSAAALAAFAREHGLAEDGALTDGHLAALRAAPDAKPRRAPAAAAAAPARPPAPERLDESPTAEGGEAAAEVVPIKIWVRYRVGLRFIDKRCEASAERVGGVIDVSSHALDCVSRIVFSVKTRADGALESGSLNYDGRHNAALVAKGGYYEADFGVVGPRGITFIRVYLPD